MDISQFVVANEIYVKLYGIEHILYLTFCMVAIFLFIYRRDVVIKNQDKIFKIMFWVSLCQQVFLLYGWYAIFTGFDLGLSLPLHICRVANIVSLFFLRTKNIKYLDVIFYFSVFALVSLFYPLSVYNFTHINGISYMINHLLTVLIPISAVICCGWRPTWRGYARGAVAFTVYFAVAYSANILIGGNSNYFYLVDRPFLNSWSYNSFALLAYFVTAGGFALITLLLTNVLDYVMAKIRAKKITI